MNNQTTSSKAKGMAAALAFIMILLVIWFLFFKAESQMVTIASITTIDDKQRIMEIQSGLLAPVKLRYKKEIDVEIGKDYLIVYNTYKYKMPLLVSVRE